ncbi:MAG TPA: carbohydrate-binding protein [Chloroflexota bacterium]|nr:carbohydrate-binding protein [Chloroflexota bacterium]
MIFLRSVVVSHVKRASRFALTVGILAGGAVAAQAPRANAAVVDPYTTSFPATENPISEGGAWLNGKAVGVDWHDVRTTPGSAFGTQDGTVGGTAAYADSTAILNGTFGPDQEASATVINNDTGGDWNAEVELRLRSTMTPRSSTGYEITFRARRDGSAYCGVARWNGALGNFTSLANQSGTQCAISTGDVIRATIIGSTITGYRNGTPIFQVSDGMFTSGNPGMGFFLRNLSQVGNSANFGFGNFTARTIGSTPTSTPAPTNTATPTPTASGTGVNAYATIQAESCAAKSASPMAETTTDTGGGQDMGWIRNGDWLQYNNVNFGTTPAAQFIARVASNAAGVTGQVEVHLDSLTNPMIGSLAVGDTGGWQNWQTASTTVGATTGTHTVFLKFTTGSTGYLVNVNWFNFTTSASGSPTATATSSPLPTATSTATPSQPSYTSSASASPSSLPAGSTVSINASVKSTSASTVGIAIMVSDQSGAMVSHTLWNSESFTAGQTKPYTAQWTVPGSAAKGPYTVTIGVGPVGWGSWYSSNANPGMITVQ